MAITNPSEFFYQVRTTNFYVLRLFTVAEALVAGGCRGHAEASVVAALLGADIRLVLTQRAHVAVETLTADEATRIYCTVTILAYVHLTVLGLHN